MTLGDPSISRVRFRLDRRRFLIAGAGTWWALQADLRMPGFRVRALLVGGAMTLLPVALMRGLMGQTWVVIFAVVSAAAGAGTVMAAASVV